MGADKVGRNSTVVASVTEIWALVNVNGGFVPPLDDDGTEGFMAWSCREEAEQGLRHQIDMGYFDEGNEPSVVCLFPTIHN